MNFNIEELKRKILYRSSYRGTKEMDILLKSFVKSILYKLNHNDLNNLLSLISIDDDNLYKFKNGLNTSIEIKNNKITKLFKDYDLSK